MYVCSCLSETSCLQLTCMALTLPMCAHMHVAPNGMHAIL